MASNPRSKNGSKRRRYRQRFKAMGLPCHICGQPIHYDEPSDSEHPLSFVIDEIIPVSKYYLAGYNSKEQAAQDWNNLAPAHYRCNQLKGNKLNYKIKKVQQPPRGQIKTDGDW